MVMDELARHLDALDYACKRYVQSSCVERKAQSMLRIHKQDEVRRFDKGGWDPAEGSAKRASKFLAERLIKDAKGICLDFGQ